MSQGMREVLPSPVINVDRGHGLDDDEEFAEPMKVKPRRLGYKHNRVKEVSLTGMQLGVIIEAWSAEDELFNIAVQAMRPEAEDFATGGTSAKAGGIWAAYDAESGIQDGDELAALERVKQRVVDHLAKETGADPTGLATMFDAMIEGIDTALFNREQDEPYRFSHL